MSCNECENRGLSPQTKVERVVTSPDCLIQALRNQIDVSPLNHPHLLGDAHATAAAFTAVWASSSV